MTSLRDSGGLVDFGFELRGGGGEVGKANTDQEISHPSPSPAPAKTPFLTLYPYFLICIDICISYIQGGL